MSDGITDANRESSIQDRIDYLRYCAKEARYQGDMRASWFYADQADKLEKEADKKEQGK